MDYDDYDRPPRGSGGYDEMQDASAPNVSFLLTLLTMLDFTTPGQVGKEDWERGIAALHAPGLSWEVSWQMLLRRFDLDNNGSIDFGEMHGLAPLDPRLGALLRVMTQTIVHLSERINGAYAGINETKMKMLRGTINQWKEKSLANTFRAWKADVQKTNETRRQILANFKYAPCRKCLRAMHDMIATRKSQMQKAANMMVSGEMRLKQMTFTMWRDAHAENQAGKNKKLMLFFMGREEWWRMHVIETWRTFTRHERGIRRFLMRWMFMGMAKTFTAWQRHGESQHVKSPHGKSPLGKSPHGKSPHGKTLQGAGGPMSAASALCRAVCRATPWATVAAALPRPTRPRPAPAFIPTYPHCPLHPLSLLASPSPLLSQCAR